MSEYKQQAVLSYFEKNITECCKRKDALLADERKDEANFEVVRGNVFHIFKTLFEVTVKDSKDKEFIQRTFLIKAEQIPEKWKESYKRAMEHNDVEKIQIESIKLETAEQIKASFISIWEGKE